MKKFNKIAALGLAAMMSVSAMGISAMAADVVDLGDGVQMTVYYDEDMVDEGIMPLDVDDETFSMTAPAYTGYAWIYASVSGRNLVLDSTQSVLNVEFNSTFNGYAALYNATTGQYSGGGNIQTTLANNRLSNARSIKYTGLTGRNTYRIALAGTRAVSVSGTIWAD